MRYCMTLYLKGYKKYERSKLKIQLLLSKFRFFNFDLSYFWYPLRYRVIQYLSSISQGILKIDNLLHKRGFVKTQSLRTVFKCIDFGFLQWDKWFSESYSCQKIFLCLTPSIFKNLWDFLNQISEDKTMPFFQYSL